jgi:hypothetical protein
MGLVIATAALRRVQKPTPLWTLQLQRMTDRRHRAVETFTRERVHE